MRVRREESWARSERAKVLVFTTSRCQRRAICAQEREIRMLQRTGIPTASAELLLARMQAKVDDLCREQEMLRQAQGPECGRPRITSQEA